jgi:hypothetical protein
MLRWRTVAVVLALVAAAACSDDDDAGRGPRPPDEPPTSAIDYSGVALEGVRGETTTTGVAQSGRTTILGTVTGPAGLVPGATVRIERLVSGEDVRSDVVAGPDGRFELRNVPGGRYRVRAFLAPALAMVTPDVRFLRDGEEHTFDLTLTDQRGVVARAAVAPDPPYLDEDVNLAVVVASRSVDPDGIVRSTPVAGVRVELDGLGMWVLRSESPLRTPLQPRGATTTTEAPVATSTVAFTDGAGQVRYELSCSQAGAPGLSLLVSVTVTPPAIEGQPPPLPEQRLERLPLTVPDCVDPTQTSVEPPEDSGDGNGADETDGDDE